MAIRVSSGAIDTIGDFADGFVIHVTGADDLARATEGLARAGQDLARLGPGEPGDPGGPLVSAPTLAPDGPLLRVAHLHIDEQRLQDVPDIVVRRLEEAGVRDALVTAPALGGPLDQLDVTAGAAVLRLFPHPAGDRGLVPPTWIDMACEWVVGDRAATEVVPVRLLGVELDVRADEVPGVLHQAGQARAWCDVVNGALDEKVRTASITFGRTPHVALAAGGPGCDTRALLARFELLGDVARELADQVTYACVDLEPTFAGIGLGLGSDGWRDQGGASPNLVAGELVDRWVPDAFPLQVLTAGHIGRLTAAGVDPGDLGEWLTDGSLAVELGAPIDWVPAYERRDEAHRAALDSLAPLLLRDEEVDALLAPTPTPGRRRRGRSTVRRGSPEPPSPGPLGVPDLQDISLEALPHARRGLRLSFLELAAWLAHEHHTDAPRSVSPVLATYARWFASALDDERRQALKPLAARLVGTAPGPEATDSDAEERRAWAVTDWLVRHQAPAWMRAAGLTEAADRLAAVGSLHDPLERARAADVLGAAILIAGRRVDRITGEIEAVAADLAPQLEQAAWEAWERAAEVSGWVAASEACQVGIPSELAYATDLQVIECARDGQRRDRLEREGRTIGEEAGAAAGRAVAAEAWRAGWVAARQVIDRIADLSLSTAVDRATQAVVGQGIDPDDLQVAQDDAERAARHRLEQLLEGPEGAVGTEGPWDSALDAAASSGGGEAWGAVQALARRAVDEATWEAGMAAARAEVAQRLAEAPAMVARAAIAAVAREAAGTAARSAALQAAAATLDGGADTGAARRAADAELAPAAASLQAAAVVLLEQLLDPVS